MKYYGITDKGLHRKSNQDSYVIATNVNGDIFAIVADGIGGNRGGDIASRWRSHIFPRNSLRTKDSVTSMKQKMDPGKCDGCQQCHL
jgi:serine/threonine protein phosphatase PrpC